jgi:GABA permease
MKSPNSGASTGATPDSPAAHPAGHNTAADIEVKDRGKLANRHVTMITLGGIIGASLFVGSGDVIRSVGPAAIISYLIGGLLVWLTMQMLGEMAARKPAVGSFMEYADESLGGWAAYLSGWLYWYFWVGIIAYESVVGGNTLFGWFPTVPSWAWTSLLVVIFLLTNLFSVRIFGEIEFWLASIKVITIIVFLVAGALFVLHLWPTSGAHDPAISNLWSHGGFMPKGAGTAIVAVATVIFSYFGTEIAVMAAAESVDPARGIKLATRTVVWRILLFFVGGVLIIVMAVPWNELPPTDVAAPFAYVFEMLGLPQAKLIMNLVLFTAAISVLNSGLYSAPRMLASLSDKGFAFKWIGRRTKSGAPIGALLLSCVGALAAIVANFAGAENIYTFIMNSGGLVALFVYVCIAWAQLRMRMKLSPAERAELPLKVAFVPWLNLVVFAAVIAVIIIMLLTPGGRAQVFTSLLATAVLVVLWPLVSRTLHRRGIDTRPAMDIRAETEAAGK